MEKLTHIVILLSYKDEKTNRKGYDVVVVETDGYVCMDVQELADKVCAYCKALAELKGYTKYFALDHRYCTKKDIAENIAAIHKAIRINAGVCNIYDGFYSSDDLSCLSSSRI